MDQPRIKRYLQKLELIERRIKNYDDWKTDLPHDERTRLACYKALQEVAEASNDLLAMMLKDSSLTPQDDYVNIEKAVSEGLLSPPMDEALRKLTGLRNRLVHEYDGLDETIAMEAASNLLPLAEQFIGHVKQWMMSSSNG